MQIPIQWVWDGAPDSLVSTSSQAMPMLQVPDHTLNSKAPEHLVGGSWVGPRAWHPVAMGPLAHYRTSKGLSIFI